jgi:hypothetical protein
MSTYDLPHNYGLQVKKRFIDAARKFTTCQNLKSFYHTKEFCSTSHDALQQQDIKCVTMRTPDNQTGRLWHSNSIRTTTYNIHTRELTPKEKEMQAVALSHFFAMTDKVISSTAPQ